MVDRLGGVLLTVALGFVTGGFAATVVLAWMLRRHHDPDTEGWVVLAYIVVSTLVTIGMAIWLVFTTPFA